MRLTKQITLGFIFCCLSFPSIAELKAVKNSVLFRVIDTGAGLATLLEIQTDTDGDGVVEIDEHFFIVFDTGHWNSKAVKHVTEEITGRIPSGEKIDLLFLSHPDSDHLAATKNILERVVVDTVIRTGHQRPDTGTWSKTQDAIRASTAKHGTRDVDLKYDHLVPGTIWRFGDATLTLMSGFSEPPADWDLGWDSGDSVYGSRVRNSISLVVMLEYEGKRILITGDAVGRKDGPPDNSRALATEKYLIDNVQDRPFNTDILLAPHHGSDNGSSAEFIKIANAKWVVFSAGHAHGHPKASVVDRYKKFSSPAPIIFTTDRGDNDEGKNGFATGTCVDGIKDDGVSFLIRKAPAGAIIEVEQDAPKSGDCN